MSEFVRPGKKKRKTKTAVYIFNVVVLVLDLIIAQLRITSAQGAEGGREVWDEDIPESSEPSDYNARARGVHSVRDHFDQRGSFRWDFHDTGQSSATESGGKSAGLVRPGPRTVGTNLYDPELVRHNSVRSWVNLVNDKNNAGHGQLHHTTIAEQNRQRQQNTNFTSQPDIIQQLFQKQRWQRRRLQYQQQQLLKQQLQRHQQQQLHFQQLEQQWRKQQLMRLEQEQLLDRQVTDDRDSSLEDVKLLSLSKTGEGRSNDASKSQHKISSQARNETFLDDPYDLDHQQRVTILTRPKTNIRKYINDNVVNHIWDGYIEKEDSKNDVSTEYSLENPLDSPQYENTPVEAVTREQTSSPSFSLSRHRAGGFKEGAAKEEGTGEDEEEGANEPRNSPLRLRPTSANGGPAGGENTTKVYEEPIGTLAEDLIKQRNAQQLATYGENLNSNEISSVIRQSQSSGRDSEHKQLISYTSKDIRNKIKTEQPVVLHFRPPSLSTDDTSGQVINVASLTQSKRRRKIINQRTVAASNSNNRLTEDSLHNYNEPVSGSRRPAGPVRRLRPSQTTSESSRKKRLRNRPASQRKNRISAVPSTSQFGNAGGYGISSSAVAEKREQKPTTLVAPVVLVVTASNSGGAGGGRGGGEGVGSGMWSRSPAAHSDSSQQTLTASLGSFVFNPDAARKQQQPQQRQQQPLMQSQLQGHDGVSVSYYRPDYIRTMLTKSPSIGRRDYKQGPRGTSYKSRLCERDYDNDYPLHGQFSVIFPNVDGRCNFVKCSKGVAYTYPCSQGTRNDEAAQPGYEGFCSFFDYKHVCSGRYVVLEKRY